MPGGAGGGFAVAAGAAFLEHAPAGVDRARRLGRLRQLLRRLAVLHFERAAADEGGGERERQWFGSAWSSSRRGSRNPFWTVAAPRACGMSVGPLRRRRTRRCGYLHLPLRAGAFRPLVTTTERETYPPLQLGRGAPFTAGMDTASPGIWPAAPPGCSPPACWPAAAACACQPAAALARAAARSSSACA